MTPSFLPFLRLAMDDLRRVRGDVADADLHLQEGIRWLCRAQDASPDDGVSYGFSIRGGWRPSYVETTGYIACTFFRLARELGDEAFRARALRMVRWLCSVQNADGSFSNPSYRPGQGIVFDTGQDLFGLVRAFEETGETGFLDAACRAGDWLVRVADEEGRWTRSTFRDVPHVYNARTAWALLRLHRVRPEDDRARVAAANLDWAVSQQRDGWFDQVAFRPGEAAFTHTIAYAIRGLWESGVIADSEAWRSSAIRGADAVLTHLRDDGWLPGRIDVRGRPTPDFCCLTGNVQMAIIWAKLHRATGREDFRAAACAATRFVMRHQHLGAADARIRGAVPGSSPIWGPYSPFTFPNWATKFLVDALLETRSWL
ncbi:MAG: hypothetical protein V2J02_08130 [Pseudomonadales bacterium]|jgi:uncharacterized protein YyaL (SSP411 family)|nr:hypothetical protein [Pseudomonadales bacterium]